jgi:hypothetical protein
MAAQPLTQRVAMALGEGWGCLFAEVHLALKGRLERKLSAQVLEGLQAMGSGHLVLPTQGQLALRLPGPCSRQTECHMAYERPCPGAGQTRASTPTPTPTPMLGLDASTPITCINIIMCGINIIFSLIIQSVQIRNNIICVINIIIFIIINSVNIKNIIICVINIIIIIIDIINKIINKFKKKYY